MAQATRTIDHVVIRKWIEDHGGKPAHVKGTGGKADPGILRIDFPGHGEDENLEHLAWDAFFKKFDESNLALLIQDDKPESRFNKFVSR